MSKRVRLVSEGQSPNGISKLALVTGGHRRLGGAISAALARAGYALAIHGYRDTDLAPELATAIKEAGVAWHGFVADLSDPVAVQGLISSVADCCGRAPDLLVNSAANFGQDQIEDLTPESLHSHLSINLVAPALLTKAFVAATTADTDRCIINILDQRIDHPHGDQVSYTLSKLALAGLTRLSATALAPRVRVNAVAPGLTIATSDYAPDQLVRLAGAMPLARLPNAEEVAEAVLFLARATAVTGQVIYVDAGAHMRSYERDFMHL